MELRDLHCLAAAFVALDKPNASKKALFCLWTERTALEISHLRCLPVFVTLGKLKKEKKPLFRLWTSMELRYLRCLAAAFVALDKPTSCSVLSIGSP